MAASASFPERGYIPTSVRLSHVPNDDKSNTSFPVKSIVKKYKDDGVNLLSAADWADSLLFSNVEWLVQLATRNAAKGALKHKPVLVSLGNGYEILIVWNDTFSDPLPAADVPFPVRRVNVALTLSSEEEAQTMDGHALVQRFGCMQPKDCLYEHLQYEADFQPNARPTIYLSTEHVPWALPQNVLTEAETAKGKRRGLRIHTTSSPRDSFTLERVEPLLNADAYFARIHGDVEVSEQPHAPQLPPAHPPAQRLATVVEPPVGGGDDDMSFEDHDDTEGDAPLGFYPRELLILARAFHEEPFSEKEAKWDVTKVTQKDIHLCDRLLREDEGKSRKRRSAAANKGTQGAAQGAKDASVGDKSSAEETSSDAIDDKKAASKEKHTEKDKASGSKEAPKSAPKKDENKPKKKQGHSSDSKKKDEGGAENDSESLPIKKRGRPKGSKNKAKSEGGDEASGKPKEKSNAVGDSKKPNSTIVAHTGKGEQAGDSARNDSWRMKDPEPATNKAPNTPSSTPAKVPRGTPKKDTPKKDSESDTDDPPQPGVNKKRGSPMMESQTNKTAVDGKKEKKSKAK